MIDYSQSLRLGKRAKLGKTAFLSFFTNRFFTLPVTQRQYIVRGLYLFLSLCSHHKSIKFADMLDTSVWKRIYSLIIRHTVSTVQ